MRKRIAVFANGWSSDYFQEIIYDIHQKAKEVDVDVFVFVNYSAFSETPENNNGELNIFRLPDLKDFDGVIVMANSFNMKQELDYLREKLAEEPLPCVSIEYEIEGMDYIGTDNYFGMHELAEHMMQVHNAKRIVYMGGPKEHQENRVRLQAVLDTAEENGVVIREDDILYSDWAPFKSQMLLREWMQEHRVLPDAIICANDIMAIGICEWLADVGFKVPDDVKVTGYDCIRKAQEFEPMITTVTHRWNEMGGRAFYRLMEKIEKKDDFQPIILKTGFVCGESCGCKSLSFRGERQVNLGCSHKKKTDELLRADQHFRHMYRAIRTDETIEEFNRSMSKLLERENWMEGKDFMVCMEPQFFFLEENDENLRVEGYSDKLEMACSLRQGVAQPHQLIDRKEAMFTVANEKEDAGIYIFVPLHTEDKNLGYAMLSSGVDIVESNYLYIWTRHVNQDLEQVRRNIKIAELTRKLTELSVTDILTGVHNRTGCEKILYPYLEECQKKGEQGILMIVDVDRMKTINDQYGHANGDLALRVVSSVLKAELPQDFSVARFGGDEFIVVGKLVDGIDVDSIIHRVSEQLEKEVKRREIEFPLSISMGGKVLAKGETFDLEKCLQEVDERMYAIKKKHHAKMDAMDDTN